MLRLSYDGFNSVKIIIKTYNKHDTQIMSKLLNID